MVRRTTSKIKYRVPTLTLGRAAHTPERLRLQLDDEAFKGHLYVAGATRTGKTKFLENILRQIIFGQRKNGPGMLLLDPHGTLYNDLARYFAGHPSVKRPILFVDPSRDDFVVPYNILRQRMDDDGRPAEPSVIARQVLKALAYVWGAEGTQETPTFHRMASNLLHSLYLKKYTTNEAFHYLYSLNRELREALTHGIEQHTVAAHWEEVNSMSMRDFRTEVLSTLNRFEPLVSQPRLTRMFGHPDRSIDFRRAMDEGWIILCNLAPEGSQLDEDDTHLLGTLLLADLWATARDRGKASGKGVAEQRPFVVAIDEFQNFVTPSIASNLAEASGFGLRLILAHQFPGQITVDPRHKEHGELLMRSILTNARNKVVFGGLGAEEDIGPLADIIFRGVLDPDRIKDEIYGTKVLDYKVVMMKAYANTVSETAGGSTSFNQTSGSGSGHSRGSVPSTTYDADGNVLSSAYSTPEMDSYNSYTAEGLGHGDNWASSTSETVIESEALIPVLGKELSSRQFYSLEEQRYLAMAALYDQEQRQCVVRLVGMSEPANIFTPFVEDGFSSTKNRERYIAKSYANWPELVLPADEATRLVEQRRLQVEREALQQQVGPVQVIEGYAKIEDPPSMIPETSPIDTTIKVGGMELRERDLLFLEDLFDTRLTTPYHAAAFRYDSQDVAKRKLLGMEKEDLLEKAKGAYGYICLPSGERQEVKVIYSFANTALKTLIDAGRLPHHHADEWTTKLRKRYKLRKTPKSKEGLAPRTIDHEVGLLDIKAALLRVFPSKGLVPRVFSLWPDKYKFSVPPSLNKDKQKPDGFLHAEQLDTQGNVIANHFFYLEFDRGNESQPTLVRKALGYRFHRKSHNFEKQYPGTDGREHGFRVLFIFDMNGPVRLENFCRKLLAQQEPFGRQMHLTTLSEFVADPLGPIWITPFTYKQAAQAGDVGSAQKISLFPELSTESAQGAHSVRAEIVVD